MEQLWKEDKLFYINSNSTENQWKEKERGKKKVDIM